MSSKLGTVYSELFKEYKLKFPMKSSENAQRDFNALWQTMKRENKNKKDLLLADAEKLLREYRVERGKSKAHSILDFFSHSKRTPQPTLASSPPEAIHELVLDSNDGRPVDAEGDDSGSPVQQTRGPRGVNALLTDEEEQVQEQEHQKRVFATPAQDALKTRLSLLQAELDVAIRRRDSFGGPEDERNVKKLRKEVDESKKEIRIREQQSARSRKFRKTLKMKIQKVSSDFPEVSEVFKTRSIPGRPRLETDQPQLLQSIIDIAMFGASAEERRRSEVVRTCRTLDDLHSALTGLGYKLSRSATYLRLLPRRYDTTEGKRHVVTVPVKLSRPEADHHKSHPDQGFCVANIRAAETVASILGPNQVVFLSQDDKARVPIGIAAAQKHAPILMHVEYRVSLPDHDWVVAARHKLIPSVYAGCIITPKEMGRPEAVSYSGPTFITIRSGKHSTSTAGTHATDFEKLLKSDIFKDLVKGSDGRVKPVVMISSDGGPDENPRYKKVIAHAVDHFLKHDLDAIFVFTNAPGRSAFNRVERRMAPLSKELSGVVIPHDSCGNHLDNQARTVDPVLEKDNFKAAGEVLADIWRPVVIDGHPLHVEYVDPDPAAETNVPSLPSADWYAKHVQESQYLLQVVKCDDLCCCGEMRSCLRAILPDGFLPPPLPVTQSDTSLTVPNPESHDGQKFCPLLLLPIVLRLPVEHPGFQRMPHDYYCPSLRSDRNTLKDRCCKDCAKYFASKAAVKEHRQAIHPRGSNKDPLEGVPARRQSLLRPVRVVARRVETNEVLCSMPDSSGTVEWRDTEEVDLEGVPVPELPADDDPEDDLPLIYFTKTFECPWEEA